MGSPKAILQGIVQRLLPSPFTDDRESDKPIRFGRYGEPIIAFAAPTRHQMSEEGTYVVVTNPTIGTGMLWVAAQTAFSDTAPNFIIQNLENAANPSAKLLYLDYLKLITTAAATTATAFHYAVKIDNALRTPTTDHTTNNTGALIPVNANMNVSGLPGNLAVMAQNSATVSVIPAASSAARIVGRGCVGGLNVVGDEVLIVFGATDAGAQSATTAAEGTGQPGRRVSSSPPVIIGPQQSAVIYCWLPGSAASPAPEFELGLWMR